MTYESFFAFARCGALPPAGSAVTSKRLFLRYSVRLTVPFRCKGGAPATADLDYKLFSVRNILSWAPAAIFLVIRAAAPEILGAEKFMDLAFFNSLTRRPDMPPADPWMAGNTINYYYWGYMLAATVAKAAGVTPLVAYNLALAT